MKEKFIKINNLSVDKILADFIDNELLLDRNITGINIIQFFVVYKIVFLVHKINCLVQTNNVVIHKNQLLL